MLKGSIFTDKDTQFVRLPVEAHFPDSVKSVSITVVGNELVLTPVGGAWDSFFLTGNTIPDDFMNDRVSQEHLESE